MILKLELDVSELFEKHRFNEYDSYQELRYFDFEQAIKDEFTEQVKKALIEDFKPDWVKAREKNIALEVVHQVEQKLRLLTNEDIVMKDRWGKVEFIGSVEDYIKKQLDDRIYRPVDSNGEVVTGCVTERGTQTWFEWVIKRKLDAIEKTIIDKLERKSRYDIDNMIDKAVEKFRSEKLNKMISDRIAAAGL